MARFVKDNEQLIREADPVVPEGLTDRQKDGWRPLLALADAAGGRWPELARSVAVAIHDCEEGDEPSLDVLLIGDIYEIFQEFNWERCSTVELLRRLNELDDRPWGGWSDGKGLNGRSLANRLRPYGIRPGARRLPGEKPFKGYEKDQFTEAYERYCRGGKTTLPSKGGSSSGYTVTNVGNPPKTTDATGNIIGYKPATSSVTAASDVADAGNGVTDRTVGVTGVVTDSVTGKEAKKPQKTANCNRVTDNSHPPMERNNSEVMGGMGRFDDFPGVDDPGDAWPDEGNKFDTEDEV